MLIRLFHERNHTEIEVDGKYAGRRSLGRNATRTELAEWCRNQICAIAHSCPTLAPNADFTVEEIILGEQRRTHTHNLAWWKFTPIIKLIDNYNFC
jgi:hypothetical protein